MGMGETKTKAPAATNIETQINLLRDTCRIHESIKLESGLFTMLWLIMKLFYTNQQAMISMHNEMCGVAKTLQFLQHSTKKWLRMRIIMLIHKRKRSMYLCFC